jgi:UDP-N-acetylmuramoyl-L-alanyl-D-glutamate--2,6-diaminopimelate ligase
VKARDLVRRLGFEVPGLARPSGDSTPDSPRASLDFEILGVTEDSREVKPGYLFCALPGARADGRNFIGDAAARGAAAVLLPAPSGGDPDFSPVPAGLPFFVPPPGREPRAAASEAARLACGEPDEKLFVVGITGTNGKTTTASLAEALLKAAGMNPGVTGTIDYRWNGKIRPAPNTTPEGPLLYSILKEMVDDGVDAVAMEISSHALSLGRVEGLGVDRAIFTNLTRDHLDHHGDMESYFGAKTGLFMKHAKKTSLGKENRVFAAVNADCPYGKRLLGLLGDRALGYGFEAGAVRLKEASFSLAGTKLSVETPKGIVRAESKLIGGFNARNLLAAISLGTLADLSPELVGKTLSLAEGAPGRFQRVGEGRDRAAIVDYAHSPGALEAVIGAARDLKPEKLAVLFGCGGDRDKGKRPLMGAAAAKADVAILTSDNPRTEDPLVIIAEAERGLRENGSVPAKGAAALKNPSREGSVYFVEPDRRKAIALGVDLLEAGDILLVCGKGHEDYQIVGTEKRRFDDAEETLKALEDAGKAV